MVTLLINRLLPKDWEGTTIWYVAMLEMLFVDAPGLGMLALYLKALANGV